MNNGIEELLKDGFTQMQIPHMGKIRQFLFHWKNGRRDHFPICCILRFSIDMALLDGKTINLKETLITHRGAINKEGMDSFIPCNIFHHGNK